MLLRGLFLYYDVSDAANVQRRDIDSLASLDGATALGATVTSRPSELEGTLDEIVHAAHAAQTSFPTPVAQSVSYSSR